MGQLLNPLRESATKYKTPPKSHRKTRQLPRCKRRRRRTNPTNGGGPDQHDHLRERRHKSHNTAVVNNSGTNESHHRPHGTSQELTKQKRSWKRKRRRKRRRNGNGNVNGNGGGGGNSSKWVNGKHIWDKDQSPKASFRELRESLALLTVSVSATSFHSSSPTTQRSPNKI